MPVSDLFDRARAERPHHVAVIDSEGPLTYAELGAATDRAAGWLRSQGVREGSGSSTRARATVPSSPCCGPRSGSGPSSSPYTRS